MKNSRVRLCMSSVFAIILYIVLQELVLSFSSVYLVLKKSITFCDGFFMVFLPDFDSVFWFFIEFVSFFYIKCLVESIHIDKRSESSVEPW